MINDEIKSAGIFIKMWEEGDIKNYHSLVQNKQAYLAMKTFRLETQTQTVAFNSGCVRQNYELSVPICHPSESFILTPQGEREE